MSILFALGVNLIISVGVWLASLEAEASTSTIVSALGWVVINLFALHRMFR